MLQAPSIPNVRLGGTIAGYAKFQGQLSEFRVWNTCRSLQEIAENFLSRLVGNESGLLACYRLEQSQTGCVFDISENRGVGTLQPGSTIGTAKNLPLLYSSNPSAAFIRVKGKLLTEHLTYMADVVNLGSGDGLGSSWTVTQEQRTGCLLYTSRCV